METESCLTLFVTPWTVACQASLLMRFSRQAYWGGLPCPPQGDLPDPRIIPISLKSPALAGESLPPEKFTTWEAHKRVTVTFKDGLDS